jgi:hemoglobin/transferrin/lactoferrin receptor protein
MKNCKHIYTHLRRICLAVGTLLVFSKGRLFGSEAVPEAPVVVERLPETVVTATGVEQPTTEVPYTVNTVNSEQLERELPRTLPESLKQTPAVMVQKTAHGQGSPFIRGFTGFRTLMLIDGIRLNNSVFREGPNQYWNTVDINSVDRLELVKGPSSVLYSSDAIGGTVNAITMRREEFGEGFDWGGRTLYRFASAEHSHTGRGEVGANFDENVGILIGGTWKDYGDLEGGKNLGLQPKTSYDEMDWDGKLEYLFDPNRKLVFAHQSVNQEDAWRTHRTIYGKSWRGTTVGTDKKLAYDQDRDLTYLQYHAHELPWFIEEAHLNVSHHLQEEDEHRIRSNDQSQRQGFDVNTLGTFMQFHSPTPIGRLVYGVEYYRDWVNSFSRRYNTNGSLAGVDIQGPVADDATYDLAGVYLEDNVPVGERLEFVLGGRYTYAGADADKVRDPVSGTQTNISDHWHAAVGSARVLYRLGEQERWQAFAGVSQGFRAPNLSDLTRFDIAASGELETPAPDLDPEYYISYETGLRMSYDRVWAEASYYYTVIDGMIVRTPTGNMVGGANEVTKRNAGDGFIHGVEFSGGIQLHPQWRTEAAFTWMDGEVDAYPTSAPVQVTEPVSRLMPTTFQLSLLWEHPSQKFWAEAQWILADEQDRLSSPDQRDTQRIPPGGTPGYSVYNLRAGWRVNRHFNFVAGIENLFDEDYRVHGSGLNEPGRNFVVSGEWRF